MNPPPPIVAGREHRLIVLSGRVQGVGMRPFLFRLARKFDLAGRIHNAGGRVLLDLAGDRSALAGFVRSLRRQSPNAARVDSIAILAAGPLDETQDEKYESLTVAPSSITRQDRDVVVQIAPDRAPCAECLREMNDPGDRRFGYAFTSCVHCGPRYTIVRELPYDRARTSMVGFELCSTCREEYENPNARRFHHEANCCPDCGPRLTLLDAGGRAVAFVAGANDVATGDAVLRAAAAALAGGGIVAVKGVGGYQLLVSADKTEAIQRLRRAKGRPRKPFALLVADLEQARRLAYLSPADEAALASDAAPIVLLSARAKDDPGSGSNRPGHGVDREAIAPGSPLLGLMLPASPLHALLVAITGPLVCTSANLKDEPILFDDAQAHERLGTSESVGAAGTDEAVADFFLDHDRPIERPIDDSVVRVMNETPVILRRARGFAPGVLRLPVEVDLPAVLAVGGHLKNAPAIGRGRIVQPGPYVGDLESMAARERWRTVALHLKTQLPLTMPLTVVRDLHPDYVSSREAETLASGASSSVAVQHHLAHVLAVLAEAGVVPGLTASGDDPILGVAWDGTGLGSDGALWGGECLLLEGDRARRVATLLPIALPGGEASVREPIRILFSMMEMIEPDFFDEDAPGHVEAASRDVSRDAPRDVKASLPGLARLQAWPRADRIVWSSMRERGLNAPLSHGIGRLFDGFAALLAGITRSGFEGEAAMQLEYLALERNDDDGPNQKVAGGTEAPLPFEWIPATVGQPAYLDWRPALRSVLEVAGDEVDPATISRAFHRGLARALRELADLHGARRVALSGGCFQNRMLLEECRRLLGGGGYLVDSAREIPPGDGGLSVGQVIAAGASIVFQD